MPYDNRNTIPDYILEAIPGAEALASAVRGALAKQAAEAVKYRQAGEAATDLVYDLAEHPRPKPGVTRAKADAAVDTYRLAQHRLSEAERAVTRARTALTEHVNKGMRADEFKARFAEVSAAAQRTATEALAALRTAIQHRDEAVRAMGGQIIADGWYGISAALSDVTRYVDAPVTTRDSFKSRAEALINSAILTTPQAWDAVQKLKALDARTDLNADEKLAAFKRTTGLN